MSDSGKEYNYWLSRRQRLRTVVREGWLLHLFTAALLGWAAAASFRHNLWLSGLLALVLVFPLRAFVSGLIYLMASGRLHLELDERGVGFGQLKAEWWIPWGRVRQVRENAWGTTSIRDKRGTCVDFPTGALDSSDLDLLLDAAANSSVSGSSSAPSGPG